MTAILRGIGLATPATILTQQQLAQAAQDCCCTDEKQRRLLHALYQRCGVEHRGVALLDTLSMAHDPDITCFFPPARSDDDRGPTLDERMLWYQRAAPPLAHRACLIALNDARQSPANIAHLVTVSCTGFAAPGFDVGLITSLGLSRNVTRTHVGFMGCHGALNGLRAAQALVEATGHPALLVCVEVCTAHLHYGWHPDRLVANALFADGAAAVVLTPPVDDAGGAPRCIDRFTTVVPDSAEQMTWQLGTHGFEMTLRPTVPTLIRRHLPGALLPWLRGHGLSPRDLSGWALHPGGPRILNATVEALGLGDADAAPSRRVLREHGNMSSPTLLFILEALLRQDVAGPWGAVAFGPGLTIEAALFDRVG